VRALFCSSLLFWRLTFQWGNQTHRFQSGHETKHNFNLFIFVYFLWFFFLSKRTVCSRQHTLLVCFVCFFTYNLQNRPLKCGVNLQPHQITNKVRFLYYLLSFLFSFIFSVWSIITPRCYIFFVFILQNRLSWEKGSNKLISKPNKQQTKTKQSAISNFYYFAKSNFLDMVICVPEILSQGTYFFVTFLYPLCVFFTLLHRDTRFFMISLT